MNFCPKCGFDLRKIQEAIKKEKEIWQLPDRPDPWVDLDNSGTSDTLPYKITVT